MFAIVGKARKNWDRHLNERFGQLVIVGHFKPSSRTKMLLQCDCGAMTTTLYKELARGKIVSCGCVGRQRARENAKVMGDKWGYINRRTHGASQTRTHRIWKGMRKRCRNPNEPNYGNYGGRGISVCSRWESFEAFVEDMGEAPEGMSIDRIDNDGDYEPSNCRWADRTTQSRNKRNNRRFTAFGKSYCIRRWSEETGLPYTTIRSRLRSGWSVERAITTPVRKSGRRA